MDVVTDDGLTSSSNTLLWFHIGGDQDSFILSLGRLLLLWFAGTWALGRYDAHNLVAESSEKCTLERFGHVVGDHVPGGTPLDGKFLFVDSICHEEKSNIDVLRALAARSFAILFQKDGTLIVLVDDICCDGVALGFHEISCPADGWHAVIHRYQFTLSRTASGQLVLGGAGDGKSSSQ